MALKAVSVTATLTLWTKKLLSPQATQIRSDKKLSGPELEITSIRIRLTNDTM